MLALLSLGMGAGKATESMTAAFAVEDGRLAYRAEHWAEALAAFEHACALDPGAAVPRYDAGATPASRCNVTRKRLRAVPRRPGDLRGAGLRTKIDYALGNTALALGDVAGAIRHFDACIASTASGADLDAVRRDAAINRRFAAESARRIPASADSEDGSSSSPRTRPPGMKGGNKANPDPSAPGAPKPAGVDDSPGNGTSERRGCRRGRRQRRRTSPARVARGSAQCGPRTSPGDPGASAPRTAIAGRCLGRPQGLVTQGAHAWSGDKSGSHAGCTQPAEIDPPPPPPLCKGGSKRIAPAGI